MRVICAVLFVFGLLVAHLRSASADTADLAETHEIETVENGQTCASASNGGYSGSQAQCYCWAQGYLRRNRAVGQVTYFPRAQFSSGGCSVCTTGSGDGNGLIPIGVGFCNGATFAGGKCSGYSGNYDSCMQWCQATSRAKGFLGEAQCTFIPRAQFSVGGCSVSGSMDPCRV